MQKQGVRNLRRDGEPRHPKTGHKFGAWFTTTQATCMEEGMQKRECATCGVTESRGIPKTEHAWNEGTIVLAPTTEQEGVKEWVCTACGMVRTRPIPKLTSGGTTAAPAASPTAAPTDTPTAAPTDTPAASTDAPAAETADKNGKGAKTGGKGEKLGTGETPAGPDDAQKNQKGDAPEKTEKAAPPWGESSCSRFCRCF